MSGATSKRLEVLRRATADGKGDAFVWYALAMELKSLGRTDESVATFRTLRERDPAYVPQYLLGGTTMVEAGMRDEAREWLTTGLAIARAAGDDKASGEIEEALASLGA